MAISPPVIGCLVKKRLAKGGVTGTPKTPLATPLVAERFKQSQDQSNIHWQTSKKQLVKFGRRDKHLPSLYNNHFRNIEYFKESVSVGYWSASEIVRVSAANE